MSKAMVEPAELRRFAQELKRFNDGLVGTMGVLHARLNELGQTWRDQEHKKFSEEFENTLRTLQRFTRSVDAHVPFLMRKAEKIEEYLNQR